MQNFIVQFEVDFKKLLNNFDKYNHVREYKFDDMGKWTNRKFNSPYSSRGKLLLC